MTPQEINLVARNLRSSGEHDEIRKLGAENGVGAEQIENYIMGKSICLVSYRMKEDIFNQAKAKLENEQGKFVASKKDDKYAGIVKAQLKPITEYILSKHDDYLRLVLQEHKSLERMYKSLMDNAQKVKVGNMACVADQTVFGWIDEYFMLDDKKQIEEEKAKEEKRKKEAEQRRKRAAKKREEAKKQKDDKTTAKAEASGNNTDTPKTVESDTSCKVENENHETVVYDLKNQMSIFDLM